MTQPQNDPASDVGAALARLAEQTFALQRQVGTLRQELADRERAITAQIEALDRLTDAKFVTFRTLIDAQAEKVALALASADKAVTKAENSTEKRFEGVNEFRAQLSDQARTFMPRNEAEAIINRATERIQELTERVQEMMPRTESTAALTRNTERIQEITDRINRSEGGRAGAKDNRTGIYAAIAALGVVIGVIVVLANAWASR